MFGWPMCPIRARSMQRRLLLLLLLLTMDWKAEAKMMNKNAFITVLLSRIAAAHGAAPAPPAA
jgi:hypothetical protein